MVIACHSVCSSVSVCMRWDCMCENVDLSVDSECACTVCLLCMSYSSVCACTVHKLGVSTVVPMEHEY